MKKFLRVLGGVAALCATLLFISFTVAVTKKVFFGQKDHSRGHIAVVDISGMILSSTSFVKDLEHALENKGTKAIVVRVNSPGGLVAPSQEMYDAIRHADRKIPVLISMGSLAASGGFYAAMAGRQVYANAGTLTASIGVIMEFMNTAKLATWAKVERFVIKSGKFKDVGSTSRDMTGAERELLTAMIMDVYQQFRGVVKDRRKLTEPELDRVADGRVMTGNQAKNAKLVDGLAGFEEVVLIAKRTVGLPENAPVLYSESKGGLLRKLLLGEEDTDESSSLSRLAGMLQQFGALAQPSGWQVLLLAPIR